MWIPAPHAIEGHAPGIPIAGPLSGVNQYGGYSTPIDAVFGCGHAADADAASTATTAASKSETSQAGQENDRGVRNHKPTIK